jgi:tetratricopeptide (TPR) repeat protein
MSRSDCNDYCKPEHHLSRKPERHLLNILKNTKDHHPNFALMLGAGASITSKVKSSFEMIKEWRTQYDFLYKNDKIPDECLKSCHWYGGEDEYSHLFEILYDQPSQRREYIENCLSNATPSWGYIYLVNLLKVKTFNTVLTTNFDDLLNEACYQFSNNVRPVVCAHDSSIQNLRITTKRPKIIKLHGDFLFDNIKNTMRELETLETNTRDKLKQIASEFGLIVVGYAGNDRSVMDTLNNLLKFENNFPYGIYWCVQKKSTKISTKLNALIRFPKVHLLEINGFDEFFANIHDTLGFNLQPEISDPYKVVADKLNNLIDNVKIPTEDIHPVIKKHITQLGKKICDFTNSKYSDANEAALQCSSTNVKAAMPFSFLAQINLQESNYEKAFKLASKQIDIDPQLSAIEVMTKVINKLGNKKTEDHIKKLRNAIKAFMKEIPKELDYIEIWRLNNIAVNLMLINEYNDSRKILNLAKNCYDYNTDPKDNKELINYLRINEILIDRLNNNKLSQESIEFLDRLILSSNSKMKFGALALLGKNSEAIALLKEMLDLSILRKEEIRNWSILKILNINDIDKDL